MPDSLKLDSLISVANELYGLDPKEFTAARNARAKELRNDDAVLSKQVNALRKPSPAAWVVNVLVRERAKPIEALMQLGSAMRDAQETFDRVELSKLSKKRRDVVRDLVAEGASLAAASGTKPSAAVLTEVEQCLQAGTVDEDAAAAVASGRLIRALTASGFEDVDLEDAVAVPDPGTRAATSSTAPRPPVDIAVARRRAEARKEATRLEREADKAAAEFDEIKRRSKRLEERRGALNDEITVLEERLEATETQLTSLETEARELAAEQKRAQKAAEEADRVAAVARDAAE
jgi:DNA repair exonuclease SbcCD ATPase subunit